MARRCGFVALAVVALAIPADAVKDITKTVVEIRPSGGLMRSGESTGESSSLLQRVVANAHQEGPGAAARRLIYTVRPSSMLQLTQPEAPASNAAPLSTESADLSSETDLENSLKNDYGVDVSKITANFTHTWQDQGHNIMGLPSYVAVMIGGIVAAIIVIATNSIGNRLAHPLPFFATEEQKMKDQIEQAREKVRILEEAVQAKRDEEAQAAEQEARQAAGEPSQSDAKHDELLGELLFRTQLVQKGAAGAVNGSILQAAPLLARATHVQNVFNKSVEDIQNQASDLAMKEVNVMYDKMKDALGMENGAADLAAMGAASSLNGKISNWFNVDDENDFDPPPFALLLGGMFAPAQIKATRDQSNSQIAWNSIILATCTACFIMDSHHGCPDQWVWVWIYGMLFINIIDVLCCSCIASRCATAIGTLQAEEDTTERIRKTGNSIWDMYIMLQANSGPFFKANFAYQGIIDSKIYTAQRLMAFFATFWGCLGMYITIEDVVQDTLKCDAKIILWFMHTYSWFFLLFLTWTVLGLVFWLVQKLSSSTFVSAPIMEAAKKSDSEVPFKLPIFQTLARSFLLRDSSTMVHIKARQVETDVVKLEKRMQEIKQKLAQRKGYLQELESHRDSAAEQEREFVAKYKDKVRADGGTLPDNQQPQIGEDEGAGSSSAGAGASSSGMFAGAQALLGKAETAAASAQEQAFTGFTAAKSAARSMGVGEAPADLSASAESSGASSSSMSAPLLPGNESL